MRANRKSAGILSAVLLVAGTVLASTWNQDVAVGAKWSDASNWSAGVPGTGDTAIFNQTQANTYDVDVDVAGTTRLQQVQQNHTFNGSGSISVSANPGSQFQNIMYNTVSGGTVTYNVPVSVDTQGSANWGQMNNNNGGTTIFNDSFTLTSGSLLNAKSGMHRFRGDLTAAGSLRLDGTVVIEGSGTTAISSYISTAGSGSQLYLNRTGAYTVTSASGYLRVERTDIHFGADHAIGTGTDVRMYGTLAGELISSGDYDQDFGTILNGQSDDADIDMGNTASTWTFADSSSKTWTGGFNISNVDTNDTVIRFDLGSGGGLTTAQIGQITLNGSVLTPDDTTNDGNYLYITPSPIPEPATVALFGLSAFGVLAYRRFMFIS